MAVALLAACGACDDDGAPPPPRGFQVRGETTKLRAGERPPDRSPWFDGRVVRLRAVRGETLGLEVLLRERGARTVALGIDAPGVRVDAFAVELQRVVEPSSLLFGPSRGPGLYPDVLRPRSRSVHTGGQAFFDVAVGQSAPPGLHRGELTVGAERVPVELTVEPYTIDVARSPLVWVWFKNDELARAHGVADDDGPAQLALERTYGDLFRAHGALLSSDLSLERLRPRAGDLTPDVRFWPVSVTRTDPERMAADVRAWLDFFAGRPQIPYTFVIDEPDAAEQDAVRRHGLVMRGAGGGAPRFLYAVTDRPRSIYRGAVDVFVSPFALPPPAGFDAATRFWTYNGRPPQAGNMTIDKPGTALRTWGWIAERYGVELWYAWEGLYWTDRYNEAARPTDLHRQPITWDERRRAQGGEDWGNGDGLLVYPGPLPSLRLKALRRGLTDRLLLRRLSACGPAAARSARELVARMIPRALGDAPARSAPRWPDDEDTWERARQVILDALRAHCRPD